MSRENMDLCNNPFVALFGSITQVELYKTSVEDAAKSVRNDLAANTGQSSCVDAKSIAEVNDIIEHIFLVTLNRETKHEVNCVFLEDLYASQDCQEWLDVQCLDQAVFERVMMPDPCHHLVVKAGVVEPAAEAHPVRYLCDSFVRLKRKSRADQVDVHSGVYKRCEYVIGLNSRLCFQQADLFAMSESPSDVFLDLMTQSTLAHNDVDIVARYFEFVATEIASNEDEGSVVDAFRPALDHVNEQLTHVTLSHSRLLSFADLIVFFTGNVHLAQAVIEYIKPRDMKQGKEYETTLLGRLLSVSCLARLDGGSAEFFDRPTRLSQPEVDNTESMIYQLLGELQDRIYRFIYALLKLGGSIKDAMLDWLGGCLHANAGRAKMWSHQMMPQMFNAVYSSDAFFINLAVVMLRLSAPVISPTSDHILRIQPTYCLATVGSREAARARKVHMIDLTGTCMVPTSADEPPAKLESSYTFVTECLFMAHHTLSLGFRVLHERLVQLNRELHRIQEVYRDVSQHAAADTEPAQRLKEDMERIMTVYLSLKAALSQPVLLDSCFTFYTATATYLVKLFVDDDAAATAAVAMPTSAPSILRYIPELLVENVQDFMLFLRHFKDQLFEQRGSDDLEQLLSFILVFMGSPEYMRNPHLRAGMAEALETLLPPRSAPSQPTMSLLSTHFQRERLFETHPMVERLSTALVSVFVSIEMTGQGVEFEHKFKYRQPMYVALEYIWRIDSHRSALKALAAYAEEHVNNTEAPLFLRFINLLINDAIFLLDEALSYMTQIREKQAERETGAWQGLPSAQRVEAENGYRHMSMLARFHNIMGNETIHALEMMTTEIRTIFTNAMMVDRIAAMLNYFLLHLVGPKKKNLKVKNFEEFQFRPRELVANICRIYVHLGEDDDSFCRAVSRDGRSYSHALFEQAELVLCKIHESADMIASFSELGRKIQAMACEQDAEDEALANVPEDFLDPIMGDLMRDPVILPSSGKILDRATIARHILSDQFDPFNRQPLTMDMLQPATELKQQIDSWLADNRKRKD